MEKTIKVLLFDSVAGRGFAYGKGENDIPESIARDLIKSSLAAIIGQKASETPAITSCAPSDFIPVSVFPFFL